MSNAVRTGQAVRMRFMVEYSHFCWRMCALRVSLVGVPDHTLKSVPHGYRRFVSHSALTGKSESIVLAFGVSFQWITLASLTQINEAFQTVAISLSLLVPLYDLFSSVRTAVPFANLGFSQTYEDCFN